MESRDLRENPRFVSDLAEPLLQLLDPRPGEAILDLGCGDGALTEKIAGFGCDVYGADSNLAQTRAAKARGVRVAVMDGQRLYLRKSFDAIFTNAALHWMKPQAAGAVNCLTLRRPFA